MQIGTVIVYRERGRLALGAITTPPSKTSKGKTQVEIVGEDGKKSVLIPDRIVLDCAQTVSPSQPPAALKKHFQELRQQVVRSAQRLDLRELWELLQGEDTGTFSWQELAAFVVSGDDRLAMAGVLDALWNEGVYFKEKQLGEFVLRDAKSVEELLHQQAVERQRVRAQAEFVAWVQTAQTQAGSLERPDGSERFLALLTGLALHGENYDKKSPALKLLAETGFRAKGHPWDVAFQLLVALGVWDTEEELSLLRYDIPTRFSDEVLAAAEAVPAFPPGQPGYQDLRSLLTFTIDDAETSDIDDALSLSEEDGRLLIGVHITDAGFFVPPGGTIDRAALQRGTTVYLPRLTLPMLPPTLSQQTASLVAGQDRPVLSFFASLDERGQLRVERICRSVIRVARRLTYAEADALLETAGDDPYTAALQQLNTVAERRRARRVENGAVIIEGSEVKVRVSDSPTGDPPEITVAILANDSPTRRLVGECMILANEIAARYCQRHDLPALYIGQPPPDEAVPSPDQCPSQQVYIHAARRLMKPAQRGTLPVSHSALGLDSYTQVTSPLRRYHDLQMHHQIKHHLAHGSALFDEERLQLVAAGAQESSVAAKRCERESTRYWLLRCLETRTGQQVDAQVVREWRGRSFVELEDTLLVVPMNLSPRPRLGTRLRVTIGQVDARRDTLSVRLTT
ncbi:MAG: VacB/RNase II family 3'-5' exoribonuclease [Desulfurellaceae bacterium]|nr:VacB/RNase II family 3'-5' exoribonuclease [Desulfurellaceae bacterium]